MREWIEIVGVCTVKCKNDVRFEKLGCFPQCCFIAMQKRVVLCKGVNWYIDGSAVALAGTFLTNAAGSRKQVSSCFMNRQCANIRFLIKRKLDAISVMGISINISNACSDVFTCVFNSDGTVVIYTKTGSLSLEAMVQASAKMKSMGCFS